MYEVSFSSSVAGVSGPDSVNDMTSVSSFLKTLEIPIPLSSIKVTVASCTGAVRLMVEPSEVQSITASVLMTRSPASRVALVPS